MEVVEALAKHSGLVVVLDADTLPRMKPAEALLQMFDDVLVHESTSAIAKWRDNHGLSCRRPASVRKPGGRRSSRPAITHARPSPVPKCTPPTTLGWRRRSSVAICSKSAADFLVVVENSADRREAPP